MDVVAAAVVVHVVVVHGGGTLVVQLPPLVVGVTTGAAVEGAVWQTARLGQDGVEAASVAGQALHDVERRRVHGRRPDVEEGTAVLGKSCGGFTGLQQSEEKFEKRCNLMKHV